MEGIGSCWSLLGFESLCFLGAEESSGEWGKGGERGRVKPLGMDEGSGDGWSD